MNPFTLTSIGHPYSVLVYSVACVLAVSFLTDLTQATALTEWLDPQYAALWAIGLGIGGLVALGATVGAVWTVNHRLYLEALGSALVAALWAFYVVALFRAYPGTEVLVTKVVFIGLSAACAARAVQCVLDRMRYLRTVRAGIRANPAPLADPGGGDHHQEG